ncbi:hypothetical protein BDV95DRAFT_612232 [Massariosphaeria phaeospora]|uniref:Uncharacterized protein n=1 Tax=Massariosphaeria phaeospora TaxID=100035 RepID=A0A7C8HZA1_9PLEO|nr:hypothetical protein BDV95DRAFT_612232 [Massariosphaeria phaeospora]
MSPAHAETPTSTSWPSRALSKTLATSRTLLLARKKQKPASKLTALPPELRNRIVELALTHARGLTCLTDLATGTIRIVVDGDAGPATWSWRRATKGTTNKPKSRLVGSAVNQLQYVCRQLRDETAGQEMRYNTLRFPTWSAPSPRGFSKSHFAYDSFALFYRRCSPRVRAALTRVVLEHDYDYRPRDCQWTHQSLFLGHDMGRLHHICRERPQMRLLVRYPYLEESDTHTDGCQWVVQMCVVQRVLRGDAAPLPIWLNVNEKRVVERGVLVMRASLERDRYLKYAAGTGGGEVEERMPDNLRVGVTYGFAERWFEGGRHWYNWDVVLRRFQYEDKSWFVSGAEEVDREKRIEQARRLFDEGA